MNNKTVGVIITCYNMSDYIEQAIRSVVNQTYKDVRIYIVDDKSTDGSQVIVQNLANELNDRFVSQVFGKGEYFVRVLWHEKNMGAGQARRTGINQALIDGCNWIMTLDADDWLDRDFIESLVAKANETDADIVSGGITVERGEGYYEATCYGDVITEGMDRVTKFWGERVVFMNNKIIHRSVAEKVPYCTRRFIEDTPTIIPMLYHANKVAYCKNVGYHYRMQDDSLTHTSSPLKWAIYRALCADDLMSFFEQQEDGEMFLKTIPMGVSFNQQLQILKSLKPTKKDVEPYADDFADLGCRIIKRLN